MQTQVPRMIDTLKYAKKLQAAGGDREAAELQAETLLVTKEDLHQAEHQLNVKIDAVDKRMDIMELHLTKQMHSMTVRTISILGTLMALFSALTALVHLH